MNAAYYSSIDFGFSTFYPKLAPIYKELREQKNISIYAVWGIIDALVGSYNEILQNCDEYNEGYHQAFDKKLQLAQVA